MLNPGQLESDEARLKRSKKGDISDLGDGNFSASSRGEGESSDGSGNDSDVMEITNEEVCIMAYLRFYDTLIQIGFIFVARRHPAFENYPIQAPHHLNKSEWQAATTSQEVFTAHNY